MRIMDVQKFIGTQYKDNERRRVSQYTRFLEKHVDFVTYFSINKILSTTSIGNFAVDSYIGKDSPVRYNRINNFPLYGFPLFTDENSYGEDGAGLNMDDFGGQVTMLPEIIEPSEGDCFILNMYDENRFFIVTEVTQVALKGKSHYILSFTSGIPDYLSQLKKQVIDEYNAIFDNIGTEDRVVISNKDYKLKSMYENTYKFMYTYYIHKFFNKRNTLFQANINVGTLPISYTDIYCTKFMQDNRIIIMDKLLKECLVMDYNKIYDDNDYFDYMDTLYWAIENKDTRKLKKANYITIKKMVSPFSLSISQYDSDVYLSELYNFNNICDYDSENNYNSIEFNFTDIVDRINSNKFYISDNAVDRCISIIVRYLNDDKVIQPGYFSSIEFDTMTELEQYLLIPIILFIIRYNIYGLTHLNNII